ncbi:MAG TPA: ferritin family protein [Opitutales bacterium]|nr:ferritin family protein [Opitutales bacterium]
MPTLSELTEREVLALAISSEEEDSRIYQTFADKCRENFPSSTKIFEEMADEERAHRDSLYRVYKNKFGEHLPPIRREDVSGFLKRRPVWLTKHLTLDKMRQEVAMMEMMTIKFYERAATQSADVTVRELFVKLAEVEKHHEQRAVEIQDEHLGGEKKTEEELIQHRIFVLQYVQPGLTGLIDGSVSTLAPLFAAAFATQSNHETFLVGLAASLGAGISMGISEAMADDGKISGRGSPWLRGVVCGLMTTLGGIGHTIPYLIPDSWNNAFLIATSIAGLIVAIELVAIAWVRTRYMETPFFRSVIQVIMGGALVLAAGAIIGSA